MKKIVLSFVTVLLALPMSAKVTLPKIFSDGMVIQRETKVNFWGTAKPNADILLTTTWNNYTQTVKSDKDGKWKVAIDSPGAGGPYKILFNDGEQTVLKDVLVGEVWICSGQSNMEMQMKGFKAQPVAHAIEEQLNGADNFLRSFTVKRNSQLHPIDDVTGSWSSANAQTIRDFSATAYFFGKQLRKILGVPVGLIVTSWGGSSCEAWSRAEWLQAYPETKIPQKEEDIWSKNRCATVLYNGMLHPLLGYTMRGVIWYQGEDNVPRYKTYAGMLSNMIKGWRADWQQGDFPFYYCQIAPYDYSLIDWKDNSALLREQQLKVESMVDNARMAVLMDAGLEYGIHPRKKKEAGERLAILALAHTYGIKGLPEFATYSDVTFKNDTAIISFARSKEWVYFEHGTSSDLFEVAGEDKVFHPAKAWIDRNKVYVKSKAVKKPVAVRYAFKNWAEGDLMHDGLPVSSFRTDDWEVK